MAGIWYRAVATKEPEMQPIDLVFQQAKMEWRPPRGCRLGDEVDGNPPAAAPPAGPAPNPPPAAASPAATTNTMTYDRIPDLEWEPAKGLLSVNGLTWVIASCIAPCIIIPYAGFLLKERLPKPQQATPPKILEKDMLYALGGLSAVTAGVAYLAGNGSGPLGVSGTIIGAGALSMEMQKLSAKEDGKAECLACSVCCAPFQLARIMMSVEKHRQPGAAK